MWFLTLSEALWAPLLMIIFGAIFRKAAPKKINSLYGYRTTMSMKNRDTWEFAHHYFGRIWFGSAGGQCSFAVFCYRQK